MRPQALLPAVLGSGLMTMLACRPAALLKGKATALGVCVERNQLKMTHRAASLTFSWDGHTPGQRFTLPLCRSHLSTHGPKKLGVPLVLAMCTLTHSPFLCDFKLLLSLAVRKFELRSLSHASSPFFILGIFQVKVL
jgi:hypothetical protein